MAESCPPTLAAAQARIAAVRPAACARRATRSTAPSAACAYVTHGLFSLADVPAGVAARHELAVQHKFVYELGWRAYFRHVWRERGDGILRSLHDGPLPDVTYATELPADVRHGCTGVPAIDEAVRAYRLFLRVRPMLQRWASRLDRPA